MLAFVDAATVLAEFPADATSVPEPFSPAAGWAAEDEPAVEPEPGPPTIASSSPPPSDPSLPTRTEIVMSVGLRPATAKAVENAAGSGGRPRSRRYPARLVRTRRTAGRLCRDRRRS